MTIESPQDTSAEARFARQAIQLQGVLIGLLQRPIEHPFPELSLSVREITLLFILGSKPETTMTDLAGGLHAPLSTVTRMVDRLETKGLIERSRSEQDRRLVVVRESEKAKVLRKTFEKHQLEIAHRILEPLSFGEREILVELMTKLGKAELSGSGELAGGPSSQAR